MDLGTVLDAEAGEGGWRGRSRQFRPQDVVLAVEEANYRMWRSGLGRGLSCGGRTAFRDLEEI
jgi:hypothetical protein